MTPSARALGPGHWRGLSCALLVVALTLVGCSEVAPDRHRQVDQLTDQIRSMPGVQGASSELTNDIPSGYVHFWLSVDVAEDVTPDQVAAITTRYLDELRSVDYSAYTTELDVHRGENLFAVDSGRLPVDNADQIVSQGRDWVGLLREFPSATTKLRAAITRAGSVPIVEADRGHPALGAIQFPEPADYTAVSGAVATLGARFPQLAGGVWTIDASKAHPAEVMSFQRFPSPAELAVWSTLNADQAIPHVDALNINAPQTPPVWISEQTISQDPAVALQLANAHLPIVSTLPRPVLYTASTQLQGRRDFNVRTTGPVAVTIGGCTVRTYRPDANEQRFIDGYENCRK
ncbi:MAG: hypothetical protein QOJ80_7206 [Mycobacterium sp.]|jgi:hypothetical protein|nr:hypothetical protein [Mycobacterium sp.]